MKEIKGRNKERKRERERKKEREREGEGSKPTSLVRVEPVSQWNKKTPIHSDE